MPRSLRERAQARAARRARVRRVSVLCSLLGHTAIASAAAWITAAVRPERAGPPALAARLGGATAVEPAPADPPLAEVPPLPRWPAVDPRPAALPADPPPPDDSLDEAPTDIPPAAAPLPVPPTRDWRTVLAGYERRRPRASPAAGDGVTPPRPLWRRPPTYPDAAARRREGGTVCLAVRVAADGTVAEVRVTRSSGSPLLDAAAVTAARGWRFAPARIGVTPIPAWVDAPIRFAP